MKYRKHLRFCAELYRQPGYFFVTAISRLRLNIFIGENKNIIIQVLNELPRRFPGWTIDIKEIMPNHVHVILKNSENDNPHSLGDVMRAFKSLVYYHFKNRLGIQKTLWQKNYYERIIRSERELYIIREYIRLNPEIERYDWDKIVNNKIGLTLEHYY